jgi:hypothetical protein
MDTQARYKTLANSRLLNMYPESVSSDGKHASAFFPWFGYVQYALDAVGEVRGMWKASNGAGYAVIGSAVYTVTIGALSSIGTIGTSSGRVGMCDNGTQLIIVDGDQGYIVTLATNTITTIADADFPNGTRQVAYLDTYFIAGQINTQNYFYSDFNNGLVWNALDFGTAESDPDLIVGTAALGRLLYQFGVVTTETFTDSGDADFPFARSGLINVGCAAPETIVKADNAIFMIGQDKSGSGIVYRISGNQAARVSTHAIEYQISLLDDISDAIATVIQDGGHTFIQFTFPTDSKSFTYDVATGAWFECGYLDGGLIYRDRINCHMFHEGKHLVGDFENGKIYQASQEIYDHDGAEMIRLRSFAMPDSMRKRVLYGRIELDCEFGVGLSSGQGSDPLVMIRYSDDNGNTWSSSRTATLGKIGEYYKRAYLLRCGSGRSGRIWEVSCSDPVRFSLSGAYCDVEACDA